MIGYPKSIIISLFSYRGGTGKSTFAANLGLALAKHGKTVLIDLDFYSPQIQYIFDVNSKSFLNDYYSNAIISIRGDRAKKTTLQDIIIPSGYENFDLILSDPKISLSDTIVLHNKDATNELFPFMRKMLKDLKTTYNFIILDCPAEMNYYTLNAIALSTRIIGVLIPTMGNVKGIEQILKLSKEIIAEKFLDIFFTLISTDHTEKKVQILNNWKQHFLSLGAKGCTSFNYSSSIAYKHQFENNFVLTPQDEDYKILNSYVDEILEG